MSSATAWVDRRLTLGETETRRLTSVLRETLRLASAEGGSIDAKALEEGFALARTSLSLLEHAFDKAGAVVSMNEAELASYAELQSGIEQSIARTQEDIAASKLQLEEARRVKRNKQEYDMVASKVEALPSRAETAKKIAQVQSELEALEATRRASDEKLELRRRQFALLMHAAHDLQQTLEDADADHDAGRSVTPVASGMDTAADAPAEAPPSA